MSHPLRGGEKHLSVVLRGIYTTSSRVFPNPDAMFEEQRAQFVQLDGLTGGGIELCYRWPGETFFFSLTAEFLSSSQDRTQLFSFAPSRRLPVTEGIELVPLELGMHAFIPLGSETMRLSMGGGIGAYVGKRILRVAGVDAVQQNSPTRIGIHIASAFEYQFLPGLWVRGELKFRDPELRTVSRFAQARTEFEGLNIAFPQNDLSGRINVNGMSCSLGITVELL